MRCPAVMLSAVAVAAATLAAPSAGKIEPVATSLGTGHEHTCVSAEDTIRCAGGNEFGELGRGDTSGLEAMPVPEDIAGTRFIVNPIMVAGGLNHTCALVHGGEVATCWGWNAFGQLGTGDFTDQNVAIPIGLSGRSTEIVTGASHTCALSAAGTVSCWGLNEHGQVGVGRDPCDPQDYFQCRVPNPAVVSGLGAAEQITAGKDFTCALSRRGTVSCWGVNLQNAASCTDQYACDATRPVAVRGLRGEAMAISAGQYHACALESGGRVQCWGDDQFGQLGDGGHGLDAYSRVPVTTVGKGAAAIGAGWDHTCLITTKGGVACWGRNQFGEVGDGTERDRTRPVPVDGLGNGSDVTEVAGGYQFTCARIGGFEIRCWGKNEFGALGDGTTTSRTRPVRSLFVGPTVSFILREKGLAVDRKNGTVTTTEISGHGTVSLKQAPGVPGRRIAVTDGVGTLHVFQRVAANDGTVDNERVTLALRPTSGEYDQPVKDGGRLEKLGVEVTHTTAGGKNECPRGARGTISLADNFPDVGDFVAFDICGLPPALSNVLNKKKGMHIRLVVAIAY